MPANEDDNLVNDWPAGPTYQNVSTILAMTYHFKNAALLLLAVLTPVATPARATLFSLTTAGTISFNSSGDATIPIGTPWSFEFTYNTTAPDLDSELTGSPDPTFGRFTNSAAPPALTFFHYKAGTYEVTLDDPADFGAFSEIHITFTSVNAIDININAPTLFPHLAGGPVSFHADFNAFSTAPIFSSDALPTNTTLGPASFDQSSVTLLPPAGAVLGSNPASLTLSLSGDFNNDDTVDAADYVYWNKNFSGDHAKYDAWRANFGASLGPGSGTACSLGRTAVGRRAGTQHTRYVVRRIFDNSFPATRACNINSSVFGKCRNPTLLCTGPFAHFPHSLPRKSGDLNTFQRRQKPRDVVLSFVLDYFRGRNRQCADEVSLVVVHAEIKRIMREINAALRVLSVNLIAEEIELSRFQFHHERAFRRIRTVARLATLGNDTRVAPTRKVGRSAAVDSSFVLGMSRVITMPPLANPDHHRIARVAGRCAE